MGRQLFPVITVAAAITLTAAAGAAAQSDEHERGKLLYQNHCQECHTTEVHFREQRKAASLDDIRSWVRRWQADLKLDWGMEEIEDVAQHLNARFYQFPE